MPESVLGLTRKGREVKSSTEMAESIVIRYASPDRVVSCMADDLIDDVARVIDSYRREINGLHEQMAAWRRLSAPPRSWADGFFRFR